MKKIKDGFTLIELLVVVLIIGILAAIALPQYLKAVEKSRIGGALSIGRAIMDAQERYYMANGNYSDSLDNLDISVTCPKGFWCDTSFMTANYSYKIKRAEGIFGEYHLVFNFKQRNWYNTARRIYCFASQDNKRGGLFATVWGKRP